MERPHQQLSVVTALTLFFLQLPPQGAAAAARIHRAAAVLVAVAVAAAAMAVLVLAHLGKVTLAA
jgi:hypothetical protein